MNSSRPCRGRRRPDIAFHPYLRRSRRPGEQSRISAVAGGFLWPATTKPHRLCRSAAELSGHPCPGGEAADPTGRFARGPRAAFRQARLHSPQAVPGVRERLRGKLAAHGITLTADIIRALTFAIVNDRGRRRLRPGAQVRTDESQPTCADPVRAGVSIVVGSGSASGGQISSSRSRPVISNSRVMGGPIPISVSAPCSAR